MGLQLSKFFESILDCYSLSLDDELISTQIHSLKNSSDIENIYITEDDDKVHGIAEIQIDTHVEIGTIVQLTEVVVHNDDIDSDVYTNKLKKEILMHINELNSQELDTFIKNINSDTPDIDQLNSIYSIAETDGDSGSSGSYGSDYEII